MGCAEGEVALRAEPSGSERRGGERERERERECERDSDGERLRCEEDSA